MDISNSDTEDGSVCRQVVLDFNEMPQDERRDAWRDTMLPIWALSANEEASNGEWGGVLQLADCGGALVSTVTAPGMVFERGRREICSSDFDHILVQVYRCGGFVGDCAGRDCRLKPGDIGFLDLAQPSKTWEGASASVTLVLPRPRLAHLLRDGSIHGLVIDAHTASARLAASHLITLGEVIGRLAPTEANAAIEAATLMITAAWQRIRESEPRVRHAIYATLRAAICDHIEANLQRQDLAPTQIAAAFRVSRATLYRLFEIDGGVAAYVQNRRLHHCFDLLCRGRGGHRRIADLAFDYGFSSESHFSRAFRQRFGISPSEARRQHEVDPRIAKPDQAGPGVAVGDWLTALRTYGAASA